MEEIKEQLGEIKEQLREHDGYIRVLEKNDVRHDDNYTYLCDILEKIISALKWAAVTVISSMLTILIFIIEAHIK